MRQAMRQNHESRISEILKTTEDIKRTSPMKDFHETGVQCSEQVTKTRMCSMDLERQILNVTPPEI